MRRLALACLLLVGFGCGDDEDPVRPDGGAGEAASGGAGTSGHSGSGTGGRGGSGASGQGGPGGQSGNPGSGGTAGGGGSSGAGGVQRGMIKLVPNVVAGQQLGGGGSGGIGSQQSALRVGIPNATTLLSLKYYVTSIQLCEDVELMGSGFSNISGCINLYQNMPVGSPDYTEYKVEEAMADDTPGRYIDLMSAQGQAALRRPVMVDVPIASGPIDVIDSDADGGVPEEPVRQPGVYRYGLINFYRPIKVKAEFPILGETSEHYFRTKAVTAIHEMPGQNGGLGNDTVSIGDTLSGATEETTYMLNNGGVIFVFQKPFAITQADVDNNAEINIDLVFNPDSFGQAYETDCSADIRVVVCDPANNVAIDMPFVRMSPVPRKSGEKTLKETYMIDYDANSRLRVELYYNDADPNKGIQGVDTAIVYNPTAPNLTSFNSVASNFVTEVASSVSFLDYRRMPSLEGLVRRQDGTVTIHCLYPGGVCSSLDETFTRAYEYIGETVVSGGN